MYTHAEPCMAAKRSTASKLLYGPVPAEIFEADELDLIGHGSPQSSFRHVLQWNYEPVVFLLGDGSLRRGVRHGGGR
jgi:hypothetical protein